MIGGEGAVEEGLEEALGLPQRLALVGAQAFVLRDQDREVVLLGARRMKRPVHHSLKPPPSNQRFSSDRTYSLSASDFIREKA